MIFLALALNSVTFTAYLSAEQIASLSRSLPVRQDSKVRPVPEAARNDGRLAGPSLYEGFSVLGGNPRSGSHAPTCTEVVGLTQVCTGTALVASSIGSVPGVPMGAVLSSVMVTTNARYISCCGTSPGRYRCAEICCHRAYSHLRVARSFYTEIGHFVGLLPGGGPAGNLYCWICPHRLSYW